MSVKVGVAFTPVLVSVPPFMATAIIFAIWPRVTLPVGSKLPSSLPLMTFSATRTLTASVCWISSASLKSAALAPIAIMPTSMMPDRARLRTRLRLFMDCFLLFIFDVGRRLVIFWISRSPEALRPKGSRFQKAKCDSPEETKKGGKMAKKRPEIPNFRR